MPGAWRPAGHARDEAPPPAPAGHGSGLLRKPPLASPRAALRAVKRAAGPRRAVSDGPASAGGGASSCLLRRLDPLQAGRDQADQPVRRLVFSGWLGGSYLDTPTDVP